MADCRVKSCCCCCSLKCFGYFIGLLNLLVYVIVSAALGYLFAVLLSTLAGKRSEFGEGLDRDISQGIMILLLIGMLFLIPICCFLAYVSLSFIKGIHEVSLL
jgi:amino acid transporter